MFRITTGEYCFSVADHYPPLYHEYCEHALLADLFRGEDASDALCVVSVAKDDNWPFLVVAQEYRPGPQSGFYPGILFLPETHMLFIGAGELLLSYEVDINHPKKITEEGIGGGFWGWRLSGDHVIMSSELELAVWDKQGNRLWNYFVEPPWTYAIKENVVFLDVMGKEISFLLSSGPQS